MKPVCMAPHGIRMGCGLAAPQIGVGPMIWVPGLNEPLQSAAPSLTFRRDEASSRMVERYLTRSSAG
jgi:hypothetical protein